MEIWGRCGSCERWFYCPMSTTEPWSCPVCAAEPIAIENRALPVRVSAEQRVVRSVAETV
jgi:hypothetical protein